MPDLITSTSPTEQNPTAFGPWAMKLIASVVAALLLYSTFTNERLQAKLVEITANHAVSEERWRIVDKRLEKIEAALEKMSQRGR